jgi:hypothetical protein
MHKEKQMFTSTPLQPGSRLRGVRRLAALLAYSLLLPLAAHAAVSSVQIEVPVRANPQMQLSAVRVTLQLNDSSPLALSITGPAGGTPQDTPVMTLTNASFDCTTIPMAAFCNYFFVPPGGGTPDIVKVIKPMHADADLASGDSDKLVLFIMFPRVNDAGCFAGISPNETWTINVINSGVPNRITGVAVQSLDKNTPAPNCSTTYRPVPLNDTPFAKALDPAPVISGRIGIDAVMVLDHSGSMSSRVDPGNAASETKISRLHSAAGMFFDMWDQLRANETTNLIQSPIDNVGVMFFDHEAKWLSEAADAANPSQIDSLKLFTSLNLTNEKNSINSVLPAGSTSIGDGLAEAAGALPDPTGSPSRQIILLMSDGMQNTDPLAQVTGSQVETEAGGVVTPLPHQPRIYSVTVGTGTAVDPTINQAVATASGGFYLNLEPGVLDTTLNNFFVQVLQNMHKYSTVETQRVISDKTSPDTAFSTEFPVTTTTTSLALSLTWNDPRTRLRAQLIPPGATQPIEFVPTGSSGTLTGGVTFPRNGLPQSAGIWTLKVIASGEGSKPTPFDLMLLGDDAALNSSLNIVSGEHVVGGNFKLTAQINDLGTPLKGLNTQANARVQAFIVKPGASLGDVLSAAAVQPAPPAPNDSSSDAQRKLEALLAADPNALKRNENSITLVDDGSAASGDDKADDGRYSALIPAEFEGHYQIVFLVEGDSTAGGRFVRQQIRTVHVRSLPDTTNTGVTTQVQSGDGGSVLVATLTPKNVKGQLMGPGYANYFWFNPDGGTPVKGVDNLNGTYTARIPFTGSDPPKVSVHFLDQPVFRDDAFVPTPDVLTPGNTVVQDVNKGEKPWWIKYWWLLLLILIIILFIILRR